MKQIVLEDPKEGPKLSLVPIPKITPSDVLIKVECAPLTEFDKILAYKGVFPPPYVLGAEASGTVVEVGAAAPKALLGKNVHVATGKLRVTLGSWHGTWSQYLVHPADDVFVYDQSLPHEAACSLFGNPTMAIGLVQEVAKTKAKCAIVAPGNSVISRMVSLLLMANSVGVISVVRSSEEKKMVKDMGVKLVLDCSDLAFTEALGAAVKENAPTILVDAMGDDLSLLMLKTMPERATHLLYGTLSGQKVMSVPVFPLVFSQKTIKGFCMSFEEYADPKGEVLRQLKMVNDDLVQGGKIFGTPVAKEYPVDDFKLALADTSGAKGRVIINFR